MINKYFYDNQSTRYQLIKTNPGRIANNWLFLPGGPGMDSSYMATIIKDLDMSGNFWLIDLPANGSNVSDTIPLDYNFEKWNDSFISAMHKFENPILVGHSFGGMFPLLFPELEKVLKGFVILNSAPSLWLEEAAKCKKEHNLPSLTEELSSFTNNPSPETFKEALIACAPYYFQKDNLEKGKQLLKEVAANYFAPAWWLKKAQQINFSAEWIPQNVPTLILGGSHDLMTPYSIFENDKRFHRDNIKLSKIENAGHFPWVDQKQAADDVFKSFAKEFLDAY